MQKDEVFLLRAWIQYYSYLFGSKNLYVFDNGSTDDRIASLLVDAEKKGVNVYRDFKEFDDFMEKGTIFADLIKKLDAEHPYDFYFPLDCDEFMAVQDGEGSSCQRDRILQALEQRRQEKNVLTISAKYYHTPFQKNLYAKLGHISTTKCFFSRGTCSSLDHGFHLGQSLSGTQKVKTNLIYYEFHRKPFLEFRRSSRQKISGLVSDFSRQTLENYFNTRKAGFHCAGELLHSKYEYFVLCQNEASIVDPTLLLHLDSLGIDYTALFEAPTQIPRPLWILILQLRHYSSNSYFLCKKIENKLSRGVAKFLRIAKRSTGLR